MTICNFAVCSDMTEEGNIFQNQENSQIGRDGHFEDIKKLYI